MKRKKDADALYDQQLDDVNYLCYMSLAFGAACLFISHAGSSESVSRYYDVLNELGGREKIEERCEATSTDEKLCYEQAIKPAVQAQEETEFKFSLVSIFFSSVAMAGIAASTIRYIRVTRNHDRQPS